jgi:hypothetical protein
MARSRLPCCDGHHGFALLRRLDAEFFERRAESDGEKRAPLQPSVCSRSLCSPSTGGGAMRCDPNAQSAENHKSVMAVTAA